MWDLLDEALGVAAGGAIAAGAYFYGLFRGARQAFEAAKLQKKADGLEPPKPRCLCKHYLSYHDDKGVCQRTWIAPMFSDDRGNWDEQVKCSCQKYVGPEPLPSYYAPEI